jgi:hypothetical protein
MELEMNTDVLERADVVIIGAGISGKDLWPDNCRNSNLTVGNSELIKINSSWMSFECCCEQVNYHKDNMWKVYFMNMSHK